VKVVIEWPNLATGRKWPQIAAAWVAIDPIGIRWDVTVLHPGRAPG
jgi:hypothetical protein